MDIRERLIARVSNGQETVKESLVDDCIESAKAVILAYRFPYGDHRNPLEAGTVEPRYLDLQYRIALALYDKDGADYETGHTEVGVTRQWASEAVPNALLFFILASLRVCDFIQLLC